MLRSAEKVGTSELGESVLGSPRGWLPDHSWGAQSIASPPAPSLGVTPEPLGTCAGHQGCRGRAPCELTPEGNTGMLKLRHLVPSLCPRERVRHFCAPSLKATSLESPLCPGPSSAGVHLALGTSSSTARSHVSQCITRRHISSDCQRPGKRGT